jgi:hypothetical protein
MVTRTTPGRIALVVVSVLASACATSREYPHPLTGDVWGYFLTSETQPALQTVTYAMDRPSCEFSRAMAQTRSGVPVPSQRAARCEPLAVLPYQEGAEPVYWVFSTQNDAEQFAAGGNDRAFCTSFRQEALKALRGDNALSECEPVIVKRAM